MKKILLIDGFGLIFKAYYAFISRPLTNKNGENTSSIFGFFKSLISILNKEKPDYYLIALEGEGKCFRNEIYPDYKAHRPPAPVDLKAQIIKIINLLDKLNIPHVFRASYEADDIIGSFADMLGKSNNNNVIIYTSDKDMRQLVNENVQILHPGRTLDDFRKLDENGVLEEMGVKPNQVVDYFALIGDASDNIPGVNGVGPKTASKLINDFGNLENIYANIEKVTNPKVKEKLIKFKDMAFLSQNLAEIKKDIDLNFDLEEYKVKSLNLNNAKEILEKESLRTVITSIDEFNNKLFKTDSLFEQSEEKEMTKSISEQKENKKLKSIEKKFNLIFRKIEILNKIEEIKKHGEFCFDLETTGLDFLSDKIICASFAYGNEVFIIPFNISETQMLDMGFNITKEYINEIFKILKQIFENENILKIGQNIKFDIKYLKSAGIDVQGKLFDTMLAEYCIDASHNILNMDDLADKYLSIKTMHYKDLVVDVKNKTLQDIPLDNLVKYSGQDAYVTYKLYGVLKGKIEENKKIKKLFYEIEIPLLKVLTDMEYFGVHIDKNYLKDLSKEFDIELKNINEKLIDMADQDFNPNSPKQVAEILFNKFKLPVVKKTKTGPSTDVDVLTKLSYLHPIASLLLEYRTISKIKSTYSDSLPVMVNPVSDKIHTTFIQTGAQTGRLSSKDPNLQNIPIKSEMGRKIRKAFIPSPGNILVNADYAQVELYLLAEFSKDENLFNAFKNGDDIHLKTASLIFNKNPEEITKEERTIGKTINFSILYGQGAHRLSENLEIPRKDAANFITIYFTKYSGIKKYIEEIKESCKKTGFVETYWGRKRTIPEIFDKNKIVLANGERIAVNTTIQGTAADLIKIDMVKIFQKFKEQNLKSKLIITVHDELVFDVPVNEKEKVIQIIKEEMENGFEFHLPLKTSIKSGADWGDLY